jgi:hypothetical protein
LDGWLGFDGVSTLPPPLLGFDGLLRVHAPAAAISRLAATAPSRLLRIGRDIVLLRGFSQNNACPLYKRYAVPQLSEFARATRIT